MNSNTKHVDFNKILSSAMPSQMINPILPGGSASQRISITDDDSVFGGSTLQLDLQSAVVQRDPMVTGQTREKTVKIRTPSMTDGMASLASNHV